MEEFKRKFENVAERYLLMNTDDLNNRLLKLEEQSETGNNAVSEINQKVRLNFEIIIISQIFRFAKVPLP